MDEGGGPRASEESRRREREREKCGSDVSVARTADVIAARAARTHTRHTSAGIAPAIESFVQADEKRGWGERMLRGKLDRGGACHHLLFMI